MLENLEFQKKLANVRMLILDIDGIMTDGRMFYLEGHGWVRHFHVHDGYGLKLLQRSGIPVAVISAGDSIDLRKRIESLQITHFYLGDEDKLKGFNHLLEKTKIDPLHMAFMGDDLFDIPVLEKVGLSVTVPQAVEAVKKRVDYITQASAGLGAVRELSDAIRKVQKLGPYVD